MIDVRRLLAIKDNIETVMQRDIAPHIRAFAQQELDKVCKQIEEAREEWNKLFEPQEIDQIKQRVSELEASNKQLREIICEFAHYLACPAYVLRPETVKKITDIAAEERSRQ